MKNFKRLIALTLVLMTMSALFCAMSVSAEVSGGTGKLWVSHFNQNDVYSNAAVIFTKEFMGTKTLQDITSEYKASMLDQLTAVDPEWTDKYANHGFSSFYVLVCVWNEDNARYEVNSIAIAGKASAQTCPENGFLFAMHHDDDDDGRHNYASNAFADLNFGTKNTNSLRPEWNALLNQPVYLYNIDLEKQEAGSGIQVTGTFDSKMSAAGIKNGLTEIYTNFKSESYLYIGAEDPDATVDYYEPKNITVSFSKIEKLEEEFSSLEKFQYNESSWANLEAAMNKYTEEEKQNLTNKDIKAWADEITAAMENLVVYDPDEVDSTESGTDGGVTTIIDTDLEEDGDFNILTVVIPVVALLVIAGVVFLVVAMKKSKKPEQAKAEEVKAEEPAVEEAAEEKTEEATEEKTEE